MPNRGARVEPPASHYRQGEWPDGRVLANAHPAAPLAGRIVTRLRDALADKDVKDVSARAHVSRNSIYEILAGSRWPEIVTVAQLEQALGVPLINDR